MIDTSTVFIIDDDPAARDSINALVSSAGFSCQSYAEAKDFVDRYDGQSTGCVVTDYQMAGINGLELQRLISSRKWGLPVIIVSGYADVPTTVQAMRNGALTLLEKPFKQEELLQAIEFGLAQHVRWRERHRVKASIQGRLEKLSSGETQVLSLLLSGHGNKQISQRLELGLRTVERRRHRILRKMHVKTIAEVALLLSVVEHRVETVYS